MSRVSTADFSMSLIRNEPPLCECARFAKRPLSWAGWISGLSSNKGSLLDRRNLEFSHEHIFFEESGHNIGFGPKGLFSEDMGSHNYRFGEKCHNGSLLRRAIAQLKDIGSYNFITNNCQDFIEKVRKAYKSINY